MDDKLQVRIVQLEPARVAAAYGFGAEPEPIAWQKLLKFAHENGLLEKPHRFFGFNNPDPTPGSPNYGYEQWVTVGPEVLAEGEIGIKDFSGGLYAVTRTRLADIGRTWQRLVAWREESAYQAATHQWLEEALNMDPRGEINPEVLELDLYLPLRA